MGSPHQNPPHLTLRGYHLSPPPISFFSDGQLFLPSTPAGDRVFGTGLTSSIDGGLYLFGLLTSDFFREPSRDPENPYVSVSSQGPFTVLRERMGKPPRLPLTSVVVTLSDPLGNPEVVQTLPLPPIVPHRPLPLSVDPRSRVTGRSDPPPSHTLSLTVFQEIPAGRSQMEKGPKLWFYIPTGSLSCSSGFQSVHSNNWMARPGVVSLLHRDSNVSLPKYTLLSPNSLN